MFLFYYGKNAGHLWGDPTTDGTRVTRSAFGLAKIRRDRWLALSPADQTEGTLTTNLISFARPELHINADPCGGTIEVALADCQTGDMVTGFTFTECDPITVDRLDQVVSWAGRSDLSAIVGTAQRGPKIGRGLLIKVRLKGDAKLYGIAC